MKPILILLTLVLQISLCKGGAANHNDAIGEPSIFWRDGEWQVFQDGRWIPYAATRPSPPPEPEIIPEAAPAPEPQGVDTNNIYADWGYGWGYGFPLFPTVHRHHFAKQRHFQGQRPKNLNDTAIGNMGRTTIGIGQQNRGLAPTTVRIGQPNTGIGQTTIGIGRPTIGIGRPTGVIGPQVHAATAHEHSASFR